MRVLDRGKDREAVDAGKSCEYQTRGVNGKEHVCVSGEHVTWIELEVQHAKRDNFTTPGHVIRAEWKCNVEFDVEAHHSRRNANVDTASRRMETSKSKPCEQSADGRGGSLG